MTEKEVFVTQSYLDNAQEASDRNIEIVEARSDLALKQATYRADGAGYVYELSKPVTKMGLASLAYLGWGVVMDSIFGGGEIPAHSNINAIIEYADSIAVGVSVGLGGLGGLGSLIGGLASRERRRELRSAEERLEESLNSL